MAGITIAVIIDTTVIKYNQTNEMERVDRSDPIGLLENNMTDNKHNRNVTLHFLMFCLLPYRFVSVIVFSL